jgi:hypothetical protein
MNKIAVFYNLYPVNDYRWKLLFVQQMHKLYTSGLYDAADFIHLGINADSIKLPFNLEKFKVHYNKTFIDEFDTLYSLWQFCNINRDYKVFYFMNKGVTRIDNSGFDIDMSTDIIDVPVNIEMWRLYLEYFNIDKWQECVKLLDSHDCVGTEGGFKIRMLPKGHPKAGLSSNGCYSGNFWWATAKYISSLDDKILSRQYDDTKLLINRGYGETWIGTGCPKYYSFNNLGRKNHYLEMIRPIEHFK